MDLDERLRTTERARDSLDLARRELTRVASELSHATSHPEFGDGEETGTATDLESLLETQVEAVYVDATETRLVNNFSIAELIAAGTYHVCRTRDVPRTLREVAYVCLSEHYPTKQEKFDPRPTWPPSVKRTSRAHQRLSAELECNSTPVEPAAFVERYVRELGLGERIEQTALVCLQTIDESATAGVPSHTFAAGVVRFATDRTDVELTIWNDMARRLGLSPDSVYTQYRRVEDELT